MVVRLPHVKPLRASGKKLGETKMLVAGQA